MLSSVKVFGNVDLEVINLGKLLEFLWLFRIL